MTFRLGRRENTAAGLGRVCLEELEATRVLLRKARDDIRALHEVRKQLKKVRALLDLGQPAFGRVASGESKRLQAVSRLLARHRESDALSTLLVREARIAGSADYDLLETALRLHHMARGPAGYRRRDLEAAYRAIGGVRNRLASVRLNDPPEGVYRRRFRKTYRKVLGRLRRVHRSTSTDALHDLRKSSKRLLNQARLMRSLGGRDFTEFRRRLVALDDLLGRSRDCGLLGEILRGVPAAEAPLRHGFGLRARLEQASREARLEGLTSARDLYGRTSREFIKRMLG